MEKKVSDHSAQTRNWSTPSRYRIHNFKSLSSWSMSYQVSQTRGSLLHTLLAALLWLRLLHSLNDTTQRPSCRCRKDWAESWEGASFRVGKAKTSYGEQIKHKEWWTESKFLLAEKAQKARGTKIFVTQKLITGWDFNIFSKMTGKRFYH